MPRSTQSNGGPTDPPEVPPPSFVTEIRPETYRGREYYAARDIIHARKGHGVLRGLREMLKSANGRTTVVTITYK